MVIVAVVVGQGLHFYNSMAKRLQTLKILADSPLTALAADVAVHPGATKMHQAVTWRG